MLPRPALCLLAQAELAKFDTLLLPTAPTIFTVAQMRAEPVGANAKLGLYTNFVNFMDLAAIALPAGFRPDGLPFGVSLIGPAFSEARSPPMRMRCTWRWARAAGKPARNRRRGWRRRRRRQKSSWRGRISPAWC